MSAAKSTEPWASFCKFARLSTGSSTPFPDERPTSALTHRGRQRTNRKKEEDAAGASRSRRIFQSIASQRTLLPALARPRVCKCVQCCAPQRPFARIPPLAVASVCVVGVCVCRAAKLFLFRDTPWRATHARAVTSLLVVLNFPDYPAAFVYCSAATGGPTARFPSFRSFGEIARSRRDATRDDAAHRGDTHL